jgi:hypothetical protein
MILGTTPAPRAQRDIALRLMNAHPQWADRLDGADWERAFDLLAGDKFVSIVEADSVIAALVALV